MGRPLAPRGLAAMAVTGLLSLVVTWWSSPALALAGLCFWRVHRNLT